MKSAASSVLIMTRPRFGIATAPPHCLQAPPTTASSGTSCTATAGNTAERAVHRHGEREGNRAYEAPLPDPESRRLIREQAGLTQHDVADQLYVSRWTVARWEKPAGYRNGMRLAGREPVGELRKTYSNLLRELAYLQSAAH